jgi:hypothetical protein
VVEEPVGYRAGGTGEQAGEHGKGDPGTALGAVVGVVLGSGHRMLHGCLRRKRSRRRLVLPD